MSADLEIPGWQATRWVSDPEAFHLAGPGGMECDVLPDDCSEKDAFLRALALFLIGQK